MNIQITPHPLTGTISAPASKSYAHRWLLAAYLAGGGNLSQIGESADIQATLGALASLGLDYEIRKDTVRLTVAKRPQTATVYCGESGSTLRFLLPVAAALGVQATFTGQPRLLSRPLSGLTEVLNAHGAAIEGLRIGGQLTAGDYRVDATVSSQYITGLLFALPLLEGESRILFEGGKPVSEGYIRITLDVLERCGVTVHPMAGGYRVPGGQKYRLPNTLRVEGDWSGAAFMLAAGAIGDKVTVQNLNAHSLQGDLEILPILQRFGADVRMTNNCASVRRRTLCGTAIDIQPIPDLAQILAVVAAYAQGTTVLAGVHRLRDKESDRLAAIVNMLRAAHIECTHVDDNLIIVGGQPKGAAFAGGGDHRTVMSAAILATNAEGISTIEGGEAVAKSYPAFWQDYHTLGGNADGNV